MQPLSRRTALRGAVAIGAAGVTAAVIPATVGNDDPKIAHLYAQWQEWTERARIIGEAMSGLSFGPRSEALAEASGCVEKRRMALERTIITTPAVTFAGASIKLAIAHHWFGLNGTEGLNNEHKLALAAAVDFERLVRGRVS